MTSIQHSSPALVPSDSTPGLRHLPLPLFAVPMGLGGLAMTWREASAMLGAPAVIGEGLMLATGVFWCIIFIGHALRVLRHPEALVSDLKHPIRSAFAGGLSIGLMIIAGGFLPYSFDLAAVIWGVAVAIHLTIGAYIVRGLLVSPREAATLTPPLLLPLVGNVLAPVIGAKLGFITVSWMLFGLGALLWVIVQPLILYRISTGPILPAKMWPTLVILLAPPAVGSLALALLTDGFGPGPLAIYGYAVLVAAVMLLMIPKFRSVPFAMSWWGYTFPSAAFVTASMKAAHAHPFPLMEPALWLLVAFVTVVVTLVFGATLKAFFAGHLFLPE